MLATIALSAAAQTLSWGPCDPSVLSGAKCATLSVPLDVYDPNRGTTSIALAKLDALQTPARGQLWFVTGGPGDSGIDDLVNIEGMREIAPDLEILTFDHRGVGRSGRLGCPSAEEPGSAEGVEISTAEWSGCLDYIGDTYGEELGWISVNTSAQDLVLATGAVVGEGQEVYWWGVSYGTYLVQRALHFAPTGPDGVILDGLVPIDWTFDEFDAGLDRTARRFLEACDDDPACASHFDEPVASVAERTLADVPRPCERLGIDASTARLLTGNLLMPGEPYASLVPAIWARLSRCASRDRRAFIHLFDAIFPEDGSGIGEEPGHSPVLQRHIAYGDLWARDADPNALRQAIAETLSTTEVSARFAEIAEDWPVLPPRLFIDGEPIDRLWPPTAVPVLALHGSFDPTMPLDRISGYSGWLEGDHQQLVTVPFAEHVTLNKGDCPASLYEQFLAHPKREIDTSCLSQAEPYDWEGEEAFNEQIFGVPDRFDERGCGCESGGGGAEISALGPLLGLLARRRYLKRTV